MNEWMGEFDYETFPYGNSSLSSSRPCDIPIDQAAIAGASVGTLLYFLYAWIFILVCRIRWSLKMVQSWESMSLAVLMLLVTTDAFFNVEEVVNSFVWHPEKRLAYFLRRQNIATLIQIICLFSVNELATYLLIWKSFICCGQIYFVFLVHLLGMLGGFVLGVMSTVYQIIDIISDLPSTRRYTTLTSIYFGISIWRYMSSSVLIVAGERDRRRKKMDEYVWKPKNHIFQMLSLYVIESGVLSSCFVILYAAFRIEGFVGVVCLIRYTYPLVIAFVPTYTAYQLHLTKMNRSAQFQLSSLRTQDQTSQSKATYNGDHSPIHAPSSTQREMTKSASTHSKSPRTPRCTDRQSMLHSMKMNVTNGLGVIDEKKGDDKDDWESAEDVSRLPKFDMESGGNG